MANCKHEILVDIKGQAKLEIGLQMETYVSYKA